MRVLNYYHQKCYRRVLICRASIHMTDLIQVLPDLDTTDYTHLLPSLEKALITTGDLITLDAFDIAKRAQVPPKGIRKLADEILKALHDQTDCGGNDEPQSQHNASEVEAEDLPGKISTLDESLDGALGGGFPAGYVTEITGERWALSHLIMIWS